MKGEVIDYIYIFLTVLLTVYGQLIFKWQITLIGALPSSLSDKITFFLRLFLNPWIISSFLAAVVASLTWAAALTKFELSYAYPFTSLAFVLVFILSAIFFHETMSAPKIIGIVLIVIGVIVVSRG